MAWVSTKEAAEILGISERTIQRRAKAGKINSRQVEGIGGRGLVYEIWIDAHNSELTNDNQRQPTTFLNSTNDRPATTNDTSLINCKTENKSNDNVATVGSDDTEVATKESEDTNRIKKSQPTLKTDEKVKRATLKNKKNALSNKKVPTLKKESGNLSGNLETEGADIPQITTESGLSNIQSPLTTKLKVGTKEPRLRTNKVGTLNIKAPGNSPLIPLFNKEGEKHGKIDFLKDDPEIIIKNSTYYIGAKKIADLTQKTVRGVRKSAGENSWEYITDTTRGGKKRFYDIEKLPEDTRKAFKIWLETEIDKRESEATVDFKGEVFAQVSENARKKAIAKNMIVSSWLRYCKLRKKDGVSKSQATEEYIEQYNIGVILKEYHEEVREIKRSTLFLWQKLFKNDGLDGLVDTYSREAKNSAAFSDEAKAFIEEIYLNPKRMRILHIYNVAKKQAKIHGWDIPSYGTVKNYLHSLPKDLVIFHREGEKAFEDKAYPSILRNYDSINPGDVYVGDHRVIDVSFGEGKNGYRLWVTVWFDMRSRKVVGLSFPDKPNGQSILDAFYDAARHHIPKKVYIDNGKDYKSKAVGGKYGYNVDEKELNGAFALIIGQENVHFAKVFNARAKIVERFFRTMMESLDKALPGYTGSSHKDRPYTWTLERKKGEFYSRKELMDIVQSWMLGNYNNRIHNGEGMEGRTPNEVWDEYFAVHPRRQASSDQDLRVLLTVPKKYQLTTYGVEISHKGGTIIYHEDWLQEYRSTKNEEVFVRWHESDPSKIYIYDLKGVPVGTVSVFKFIGLDSFGDNRVGDYEANKARRKKSIRRYKKEINQKNPIELTPEVLTGRIDVKDDYVSPELMDADKINIELGNYSVIKEIEPKKKGKVNLDDLDFSELEEENISTIQGGWDMLAENIDNYDEDIIQRKIK